VIAPRSAVYLGFICVLASCGGGGGGGDAGPDATLDAGDGGSQDGALFDAGDGGEPDAGPAGVPLTGVVAIATGHAHACALLGDGSVWCWGDNRSGQLGDDTVDGRAFAAPAMIEGVVSIDAGGFSTYAVMMDGKRAAWGFDADGQLADNRTDVRVRPSIRGGTTHQRVAGGARHSCWQMESGAVFCSGDNAFGQLGNDSTRDSRILVRTRRLALDVTRLALGDSHSCALSDSGVARCWGSNARGELGVGDFFNRLTPTVTDTEARFVEITAGDVHTCGLDEAGALYCWGNNYRKRLGLDERTWKSSPTSIDTAPVMSQISAGGAFTCGLDMSSRVVCWGEDRFEQLGVSLDPPERAEILPVPGVGRATQVSSGADFACALLADTTVQCWGRDHRGQLGDGLIQDVGPPAQVLVPVE